MIHDIKLYLGLISERFAFREGALTKGMFSSLEIVEVEKKLRSSLRNGSRKKKLLHVFIC